MPGNMKMGDRECVEMCVKAGGKYVFTTVRVGEVPAPTAKK
jgi:hypothetical protein